MVRPIPDDLWRVIEPLLPSGRLIVTDTHGTPLGVMLCGANS